MTTPTRMLGSLEVSASDGRVGPRRQGGTPRAVGVQPETLRRAVTVHPISSLQSEWSLWTRELESEVLAVARASSVGIVPFSPLGRVALPSVGLGIHAARAMSCARRRRQMLDRSGTE